MSTINSASLFHFTNSFEALLGILTNGFRFSYCFESLSENGDIGNAIPMVCFCDIPLLRSPQHRNTYNNYAIGLHKNYKPFSTIGNLLNQVHYIDSPQSFKTLDHLFKEKNKNEKIIQNPELWNIIREKNIEEKKEEALSEINSSFDALWNNKMQIAYSKRYAGKDKFGKNVCFGDEREWRAVLPMITNRYFSWHMSITKSEYDKIEEETKLLTEDKRYHLIIEDKIKNYTESIISHIIVNSEKERICLINNILSASKIMGNRITKMQKIILVSKITSFEIIDSDF